MVLPVVVSTARVLAEPAVCCYLHHQLTASSVDSTSSRKRMGSHRSTAM